MTSATKHQFPLVHWVIVRQWIVVVLCTVALTGAAFAHVNHVPGPAGSYTQHQMSLPNASGAQNPEIGDNVPADCSQHNCSIWVLTHREMPYTKMLAAMPALGNGARIDGQATAPPFHPPKA